MTTERTHEVQEIIDRETRAFDTADAELMVSVYHPHMVWAWPPHSRAYDPMEWIMRLGKFDEERWLEYTRLFFDTHTVVHNKRVTQKILMADEQDGALAVVDVDMLLRQSPDKDSPWHEDGEGGEMHVLGRAAKIYTTLDSGEWKMLYQPGTMHYPVGN